MQHRRNKSRSKVFFVLLLAVVVSGGISLMVMEPKVSQVPVEKELDAKAFLEQKQ